MPSVPASPPVPPVSMAPPVSTVPLTARQAQILALIRTEIERSGMPPTRAEIATALAFRSANAAEEHLRALERKGLIEIRQGTARGLRLTEAGWGQGGGGRAEPRLSVQSRPGQGLSGLLRDAPTALALLPLLGRVAAGAPMLAAEHVVGHYTVDRQLFRPAPDYLLQVRGMSMRDAGIVEGDLLAVHHTAEARSGQIVVARIADEVTVKRLQHRDGHIELLPANPDFAPIVIDPREEGFAIEGLVVGLIRDGMAGAA